MSQSAAIPIIQGSWSGHFVKGCESSVTLREKTSWLSIATLRENWIALPPCGRTRATPGRCDCRRSSTRDPRSQASDQDDSRCHGDLSRPGCSWVDSLARPGGNITGLTRLTGELRGKRLELLKEVVPRMSRIGVLVDANTTGLPFKDYETAASALKIPLQSLEVRGPNPDFEGAFQAAAKARVSALIAANTSLLNRYPKRIADLAIKYRLPSMYEASYFVEAGGLMSYASNEAANFKRAAYYVDKILKGAKPADLPVEQPTKFEFVVNLKTAKQIGLTIPPNVLARADKVIR